MRLIRYIACAVYACTMFNMYAIPVWVPRVLERVFGASYPKIIEKWRAYRRRKKHRPYYRIFTQNTRCADRRTPE